MGKRHSKHVRASRPLLMGQDLRRKTVRGTDYLVRSIRAGQSTKDYRCPGCEQPVRRGVAHVVAWPETPPLGAQTGLEARRHWHTYCWERI